MDNSKSTKLNMDERPTLTSVLSSTVFIQYYYLKEELVKFCKEEALQSTGSKIELTNRIIDYLQTGNKSIGKASKKNNKNFIINISLDSIIEDDFICSEIHRAFFKQEIGNGFSFNVNFQTWLKANAGKKYCEAITAYYEILEHKKHNLSVIDKQFEYNTYIRDFFLDNEDKCLDDAIKCWKYKKSIPGNNKYDKDDLNVLN